MRDVRLRLDLQVILVLCLLVPVFLQDHVTSYDGGEPSMCKHVNCEESEMEVPSTEKQESYRWIARKLTRPLQIPIMSSIAVRRKLAPGTHPPAWDGRHPIHVTPGSHN
ncbi:hypothetical protein GQ55_1G082900 [Panicum hallii var. hallii]|uniref:Uncharacterized protein n=2 Tax=Panicum hallii TaxID=206008 RepID=A0A2T7F3K4_9POAL|nr:uncharacterized protein LOC112878880 [Panicum hallii]PUZ74658.1 hypothetical protein GQ55_1G082900 [Panicum hallii var. hallii]PVH65819.1 hypothetical protein PAHAL_1G084500 [Panicum hallii]